jgi:hypothetical protein
MESTPRVQTIQRCREFKSPLVRDLFWAVASPGLLHETKLPFVLPVRLQQQWLAESTAWFTALDQHPESLESWMAAIKTIRLGHRFEALIHYFFSHLPTIELLGHNIQLYENGITLGELDFVIRYENTVYHIEVAVKYYCRHGNGLQMSDWIGPSAKDRLDLKWEHLLHKQLPIGRHKDLSQYIETPIDQHLCWVKGKVFTTGSAPLPDFLSAQAETGHFLRFSDLAAGALNRIGSIYILNRPNWLSDLWVPSERLEKMNPEAIPQEFIDNKQFLQALHIGFSKDELYETVFIVADDWPLER